jgi:ketosteroid isomerase-like protein
VSQSDLELAGALYAAFARRDVASVTTLLDPEIELETPEGTPEQGLYTGHQAVLRHLAELVEPFKDIHMETRELIDAGERVLVVLQAFGRGRESGLEIDTEFFHVLTVRNGRIARLQAFFSREDAMRELA